ncbi:superfamily I DNA and/or RNA helicase [Methanomicrobium sp. W14]|uniref:AAA domain-containing protein n=1 Tax=Methanomicrobium sp. W14 TaxID=2817839 RepID=UPI001AEAF8E9|nr:AAA domain-containing protein [Methanomicrobium sp. W14]MBP2132355.1 superfamily I DNA and/or RNA helicase [Methanomicrobium sp. W14]
MSNLYFENLGEEDPEFLENLVVRRLKDFWYYLNNAENQLGRHTYKFSFTVKGINGVIRLSDEKSCINLFSCEDLFYDENLRQKINKSNIDKKNRTVSLEYSLYKGMIYAKSNNKIISCRFEPKFYTLTDIQPVGTHSDEEYNIALDFLNNSDSIRIRVKGKFRSIDFKNNLKKKESITVKTLPDDKQNFWVSYNTYILRRQREAIESLALSPRKHQIPILNLLRQKGRDFNWGDVDMSFEPARWFILTDDSRDGTSEQREFVKKAWGTPDFAILEGPPGSGKTTTLLELIAQAISRNQRILMVASTHVAVDNVLEKLLDTPIQTDDGERSLKEACGAIPLRIGDQGDVSVKIQPYCLERFAESEIDSISEHLKKKSTKSSLTEAEKMWKGTLKKDRKKAKENMETLLLDVANLICGTTIGILKTPIIENSNISEPLFDIVILDEASKTTFQEFLVPALYGKKWIISGDIKQLSPYVDQTPIEKNLKTIKSFTKEDGYKDRQICLSAFQASRGGKNSENSVLILKETEEEISECIHYLSQQAEGISKLCKNSDHGKSRINCLGLEQLPYTNSKKLEILASDIIVTKKDLLPQIEQYLPPHVYLDAKILRENFSDEYIRRRKAFNVRPDEKKTWEGEIAWRICRMHELQNVKDKYDSLNHEVSLLVPQFERVEGKKKRFDLFRDKIDTIRRIALPSVLELLQNGFETSQKFNDSDLIALYSGLSYAGNEPGVLKTRHTLLTYQYRMHPQISYLPHKYVYEGKALKNANGDEWMKKEREWGYDKYSSRCVWIDIRPKKGDLQADKSKSNHAEVLAIRNDFDQFKNWAKENPNKKNGYWSVAILTFYNGQLDELKKEFAGEHGKEGISSEFVLKKSNVSVKISSVDRYQGHEADVVFLSFVQSCGFRDKRKCKKSVIGFLNFQNRLNVAVTRARYQLVMFGDKQNFESCNAEFLRALASESTAGDIEFGGVN